MQDLGLLFAVRWAWDLSGDAIRLHPSLWACLLPGLREPVRSKQWKAAAFSVKSGER